MNLLCPYCLVSPRDSDDHVFPDFLGGARKIKSCTKCNNSFGHRFEGPVSKDLAPVIVFLSFSGYKHKRIVVHERAWIDEATGIEYGLDSERQSIPSKPYLFWEDGKVKRVVARNMHEAHSIFASLKTKGLVKEAVEKHEIKTGLRPPFRNVRISVGAEMRQLAVKMCAAVGQLVVPDIVLLDERCRQFLLEESPVSSPVQQTYFRYPELDALRPPLAHAVYIEGDSRLAKCFGVVQLFGGAFQLYAPLSRSYTGRDFAALGVLDVTTFQEQFREVERLQLLEAPRFISLNDLERSHSEWGTNFNAQVQAAFGKNDIIIGISPKQSVAGVRVALPLLWIEHEAEIQLAMDLVPDKEPGQEVSLPSDPHHWVLSPDFGRTTLAVFDTFAQKWNNNALNRIPGQDHVYVPDEIVPGIRLLMGKDFWCPVQSMGISYRVSRNAWLGSVNVPDCSGELDRSQHTLQATAKLTQNDIPMSRDPSWPMIADPDSYKATAENVLVVERWDIDANSLRFTDFRAEQDA
jgi:hypothetical protein